MKTEEEEEFCNGINPSGDPASHPVVESDMEDSGDGDIGVVVDRMKRVIEMKRVWFGR